jgi:hypothetical protein
MNQVDTLITLVGGPMDGQRLTVSVYTTAVRIPYSPDNASKLATYRASPQHKNRFVFESEPSREQAI